MMALKWGSPPAMAMETKVTKSCGSLRASSLIKVVADGSSGSGFPSFIPKEIEKIRDPFARSLCRRIVRLPVLVGSLAFPTFFCRYISLSAFFSDWASCIS